MVYDRYLKELKHGASDSVMVHMLHECTRKAAELVHPFFDRVISATSTNVKVRRIDNYPDDPSIFVALTMLSRVARHIVVEAFPSCL